jgi:hypothetical protein
MDEVIGIPTASAYSQARRKFKGELFLHLNHLAQQEFYQEFDSEIERWQGRRILAVDGTCLNLPDTEQTRERFSIQANQHTNSVQALASVLYDVLNDIGINMDFGPKCAEKEYLFNSHLAHTQAGDLLVLDRHYADYSVMAVFKNIGRDFVIRFPRHGFKKVDEFFASKSNQRVVELQVPNNQKKYVREHGLAEKLKINLVKVTLDNGEEEVLGTNLMAVSRADLYQIYGWRWGIETYYDRVKNIFELERFSGQSLVSIEQDVYATLLLTTMESILSNSADAELADESSDCQYQKQVNHSVSYSAMLDNMTELLLDQNASTEETVFKLHQLFLTNPTLSRPGRKFPRSGRSGFRQAKYHRYKRIIA